MGFDSLKRVELIVALEEEFGMEFDQSDLETEQLERVGDLVDLLSRYQEGVTLCCGNGCGRPCSAIRNRRWARGAHLHLCPAGR